MDLSQFSPDLLAYAKSRNPAPPPHFGTRYRARGGFLPEPGNTIVCHVAKTSQTQALLVEARERYLAMPEADQFVFTPITSLHMTLFQGVLDNRRQPQLWPHDIPLGTPIEEMHGLLAGRLKGLSGPGPFRVGVVAARPSGLLVDGCTAQDRKVMRAWRDLLSERLGYRHADHDTYPFHITFAYVIERLDDEALPRWQAMLSEVANDLQRRQPVLQFDPPAFCQFDDMNHFHELLPLDFPEPKDPQ